MGKCRESIPEATIPGVFRWNLRSNHAAARTSSESPHVLRHTFAVTAVQRISLPSLQRLLGHDHLGTTQIYLNLSPEEVIREFNEKW